MTERVVTVTGSGSVAAPVDRVVLTLGVQEGAPDAGAAFEAAATTSSKVLAVLADHGVDSRSVRTADLTLGPWTEWRDNHEQLVEYRAGQRLIARLEGIGTISRLLTDVVRQVGNGVRIEGLEFESSDLGAARRRARDLAWADAWARAEQYAALSGSTLGAVQSVAEAEAGRFPVPVAKEFARAARDSMPVAAGDTQIGVHVTVTWRLQPS